MTLEQRLQRAEADLFATLGMEIDELFLPLGKTGRRVRVLTHGSGPPLVLLHGVSMCALELDQAPVVGHSLGAMLALWHATTGARRISELVSIGDPAVALPGARVRMPLSLLTVDGLGLAVLRSPSPRFIYRRLLAHGLGRAEVAAMPESLLEALRLSSRRPQNASTVASLMHAVDHFRRPRIECVLTSTELAAISTPTLFIWGSDDPYLSSQDARPAIAQIPTATLHEMPGGHGPWLVSPEDTAELIHTHLTANHRRSWSESAGDRGLRHC